MQSYYSHSHRSRQFLVRMILGALAGQTPEEFAEQELSIIEARQAPPPICPHGLPKGCCLVCITEKAAAGQPAGEPVEEATALTMAEQIAVDRLRAAIVKAKGEVA